MAIPKEFLEAAKGATILKLDLEKAEKYSGKNDILHFRDKSGTVWVLGIDVDYGGIAFTFAKYE